MNFTVANRITALVAFLLTTCLYGQVLVDLQPATGTQGEMFPVTLTGQNTGWLTSEYSDASVTFSGEGISTISSYVLTGTTIRAELEISPMAGPGARSLFLDYSDFNNTTQSLELTDAFTVLDSIIPSFVLLPDMVDQGAGEILVDIYCEDIVWSTNPGDSIAIRFNGLSFPIRDLSVVANNHIQLYLTIGYSVASGSYDVTIEQYSGLSIISSHTLMDGFTVSATPRQIVGMEPGAGKQGTQFDVTVTAHDLDWVISEYSYVDLMVSGDGVLITGEDIVDAQTITASVNVSETATVGPHTLYLSYVNQSGLNRILEKDSAFTVLDSLIPTITGLSTNTFIQGDQEEYFRIEGSDVNWSLTGNDSIAVDFQNEGIAIESFWNVSPTQIHTFLNVDWSTPPGSYDMTVKQFSGTSLIMEVSLENAITIAASPPSLVALDPDSALQGSSFPMTITGNNTSWGVSEYSFFNAHFNYSGVELEAPVVVNENMLTSTVSIAPDAMPGDRTFYLSFLNPLTQQLLTLSLGFEVLSSITPHVSALEPTSIMQGDEETQLDIYGQGVVWSMDIGDSISIQFDTDQIMASQYTLIDSAHLRCFVDVDLLIEAGEHDIIVQQFVGDSLVYVVEGLGLLDITAAPPQLYHIDPASVSQGAQFEMTITGHNTGWLQSEYDYLLVNFSGEGIANSWVWNISDENTAFADVTVSREALAGSRTINVTYFREIGYPVEYSLSDAFTVVEAAPALLRVEPDTVRIDEFYDLYLIGVDGHWGYSTTNNVIVSVSSEDLTLVSSDVESDTSIHFEMDVYSTTEAGYRSLFLEYYEDGNLIHNLTLDSAFYVKRPTDVDLPDVTVPTEFVLYENFPNPFNPTTTIRYALPEQSSVALTVFDIQGRVIKTITPGVQSPGWYEQHWNGIDASGNPVGTGMYFCRLSAGKHTEVIKMIYLK